MQRGSNVKATSAQNGASHSPFLPLFSFFFPPFFYQFNPSLRTFLKRTEKKKRNTEGKKTQKKRRHTNIYKKAIEVSIHE